MAKKSKDERYKNKEWLEEHYTNKKMSMRQIGRLIGCCFSTISIWIIRFKIPIRKHRNHVNKFFEKINDISWLSSKYIDEKMSIQQIAKLYDIERHTIKRYLLKHKILVRPEDGKYRGKVHHSWKGGRTKDSNGYIRVKVYDHPNAKKYMLEHRLIMEKELGRHLESHEIVHHKNGVRDDNRISNLEIVSRSNHRGEINCPYCQEQFLIK